MDVDVDHEIGMMILNSKNPLVSIVRIQIFHRSNGVISSPVKCILVETHYSFIKNDIRERECNFITTPHLSGSGQTLYQQQAQGVE